MQMRPINPESVPEATGGYHNALEVQTAGRMLFISGQIPQTRDGHVPARRPGRHRRSAGSGR